MSKSVAIVGASRDKDKFSHKAVKAFQMNGYKVYPVNPNAKTIAGLICYPSIKTVPDGIQEVSVYLPPEKTMAFLEDLKGYTLDKLYLNPGSADTEVKSKAESLGLPVEESCSIVAQGYSPDKL